VKKGYGDTWVYKRYIVAVKNPNSFLVGYDYTGEERLQVETTPYPQCLVSGVYAILSFRVPERTPTSSNMSISWMEVPDDYPDIKDLLRRLHEETS